MPLLDILLALPLLYLVFVGWKRGLVREVATLVGVLAGIWAAVHLSQQVAPLLGLDGESSTLMAFLVTFIAALVLSYLLGKAVEGLMKAAKLSLLNRLLGALTGAAKALVVLSVLLNFVVMVDGKEMILKPETKEKSLLYKPVYTTGNQLTSHLKEYIAEHKEEWKEVVQ